MPTSYLGVYADSYPAYVGSSGGGAPTPNLGPAYVTMRWGQSNDSGLSPREGLPAMYTAVSSRVKTWNDLVPAVEPYQLGLNDNSINSRKWTNINTGDYIGPSYPPSFGPELGYQYAFLQDVSRTGTLYGFKIWLGIRNGETVNTNSTTTATWLNELYPKMKVQWQAFRAALLAMGHSSVVTLDCFCGLGEGNNLAGTQSTYKAELKQLWDMFAADGLIQSATKKYLLAKQPAQYADILALQNEFVAENAGFTLLTLSNPSFQADGIHYSQEAMLRLGQLEYAASTGAGTGGGNGELPQTPLVNIASPATAQVLNLRYNAGKAADASQWTSQTTRALAVRQPVAGKRGTVVDGGIRFVAGNQFMYTEKYGFNALSEMSWVFYVRGLVKSATGQSAQFFVYNGDEDTQGAFSILWDERNDAIAARVHSLASPVGNRELDYYYFVSAPFTGGDLMLTVRYSKSRATDCIRLDANGVAGTVLGNANKQPAFFLDGVTALFGRNELGENSLRGTVQQATLANYELSDADLKTLTDGYRAELPNASRAMTFARLPANMQPDGNGLYTLTDAGADEDWGNVAQGNVILPINAVDGVQMQYDGTHFSGSLCLSQKTGQGVLDAECGVFFFGPAGSPSITRITGRLGYGGLAGSTVSAVPAVGSYVRLWRKADQHVYLQYSATGSGWSDQYDYGFYPGLLYSSIDINGTAAGGMVSPARSN